MIQFVKTLSYELHPPDRDIFTYLNELGLQVIDPPSLEPRGLNLEADIVIHSPLKRVAQCLARQQNTTYIVMPELREVPFDISQMMTRDTYELQGSEAVRKAFCDGFIRDTLPVKRAVLTKEIRHVLKAVSQHLNTQAIAVVSHSFRLKLLEAFLDTAGKLESRPELIREYISTSTHTYPFGGGFVVDEARVSKLA